MCGALVRRTNRSRVLSRQIFTAPTTANHAKKTAACNMQHATRISIRQPNDTLQAL
jgi:hypothetical protein